MYVMTLLGRTIWKERRTDTKRMGCMFIRNKLLATSTSPKRQVKSSTVWRIHRWGSTVSSKQLHGCDRQYVGGIGFLESCRFGKERLTVLLDVLRAKIKILPNYLADSGPFQVLCFLLLPHR